MIYNILYYLYNNIGYFTVDPQYDSNMFFWFFPAQVSNIYCWLNVLHSLQQGSIDAPVLLWLQGGPGGSSLFGLFIENGPLMVDANGQGSYYLIT